MGENVNEPELNVASSMFGTAGLTEPAAASAGCGRYGVRSACASAAGWKGVATAARAPDARTRACKYQESSRKRC